MFQCNVCLECFPTFHPAYDPSEIVPELELLRRNPRTGIASCSVEVATWDDIPPLRCSDEDLLIASSHSGRCRLCDVDMQKQFEAEGGIEDRIVPRRSYLNHMDPLYNFPLGSAGADLRELFTSATVFEGMLVALEHMQVHYATSKRSALMKYHTNVISFAQDLPGFAGRVGLAPGQSEYRAGDRVNSVRGPGHDLRRDVKWICRASDAELQQFAQDEQRGALVYPATVREILADGKLLLDYGDRGELGDGVELPDSVWPRIQMPWNPRFLKGKACIFLQRNLGRGRKLEGLQVRWALVARILRALTKLGPWRLGGGHGPMHRYYDERLFDMALNEEDVVRKYGVRDGAGVPQPDLSTSEDFARAGFSVHLFGPGDGEFHDEHGCATGSVQCVSERMFCRWLEVAGFSLGSILHRWWDRQPPAPRDSCDEGKKHSWDEGPVDLFLRISGELAAAGSDVSDGVPLDGLVD